MYNVLVFESPACESGAFFSRCAPNLFFVKYTQFRPPLCPHHVKVVYICSRKGIGDKKNVNIHTIYICIHTHTSLNYKKEEL